MCRRSALSGGSECWGSWLVLHIVVVHGLPLISIMRERALGTRDCSYPHSHSYVDYRQTQYKSHILKPRKVPVTPIEFEYV